MDRVVDHVELGQELAEDGGVQVLPQAAADQPPVDPLEPGELPQVAPELLLPSVGQEEMVDDEHQQHRHGQIKKPELDGLGLRQGEGGHGEGKGGGEDGVDPGAGGAAVHKGDHNQREEKDHRSAQKVGIDQVDQQAADGGADGTGHHAVGAVLVAGLEEQKGVEGEPIGVLKIPQEADGAADGHDQGELEGEAELEPVHRAPLPEVQQHRPPGHPLPGQLPGGGGLLAEEVQNVEDVAVEDAQPAGGQAGLFRQLGQAAPQCGPLLRRMGLLTLGHQLREGMEGLGEHGTGGALPPALVGDQVVGPLVQKAQEVVAVGLGIGDAQQAAPVVPQAVELLGGLIEGEVDPLVGAVKGHLLQQARELPQAGGDLEAGVGRPGELGVHKESQEEQGVAEGHHQHLHAQVLRGGRPQLQKDEGHGKAQVALGVELAALPEHQKEEDREVQHHAQHRRAGGREGQQAEEQGNKEELKVAAQVVALLPAELKEGGGAGKDQGVLETEEIHHQCELEDVEEDGGQGGPETAQKGTGQRLAGAAGFHRRSPLIGFIPQLLL